MTITTLPEQISPEDARQATRRKGIGGSDVPKILGLSNFGTALDVWAQKLNLVPATFETQRMRWGKALEPEIAQAYMERTGKRIVRPSMITRSAKRPWMLASIDRLVVGEKRLVELKCSGWSRGWGEEGTEAVPDEYYCQVQWYLAVKEYEVADCAVLIGGNDFRLYTIERAQDFIEKDLIPAMQEFWEKHVLAGLQPKVDGSEACKRYIAARYRDVVEGSSMIATAELSRLARELKEARESSAMTEAARTLIENEIKVLMGEVEKVAGDGFQITWKMRAGRRSVDYESVARALAVKASVGPHEWDTLVKAHERESGAARVFLPKWDEEKS
jgi:putative phage-type endonuclease